MTTDSGYAHLIAGARGFITQVHGDGLALARFGRRLVAVTPLRDGPMSVGDAVRVVGAPTEPVVVELLGIGHTIPLLSPLLRRAPRAATA